MKPRTRCTAFGVLSALLIPVVSGAGAKLNVLQADGAWFPLQVSENKRFLVDQNRRPFLVVGATSTYRGHRPQPKRRQTSPTPTRKREKGAAGVARPDS